MKSLLLSRDDGKRVDTEKQLAQMRANMVEYQLRRRGIKDERVLQAFLKVPATSSFAPKTYGTPTKTIHSLSATVKPSHSPTWSPS
jgi:hypothetical protein